MAAHLPNYVRTNTLIVNGMVGTSFAIFAGWNYSQRGIVYDAVRDGTQSLQKAKLLPKDWKIPDPVKVQNTLRDKTVHQTGQRPFNYESAIMSNFSHASLAHIAFNTFAFTSFSNFLVYHLPTRHFVGVLAGSGIAAVAAFEYDRRNKPSAGGLGMSGIVAGVAMTVTCMIPRDRATMFFVIRAPMWVLTGGFLLLDTYLAKSDIDTGIGHAAHVGGATFGALYYIVFLRRLWLRGIGRGIGI
jgi:membrane associated rhomboid family serine protease